MASERDHPFEGCPDCGGELEHAGNGDLDCTGCGAEFWHEDLGRIQRLWERPLVPGFFGIAAEKEVEPPDPGTLPMGEALVRDGYLTERERLTWEPRGIRIRYETVYGVHDE